MAVSIVPRQRGKLEILAQILSRGIGGFQQGKQQRIQGERQAEQDKLKVALTQAQIGKLGRAAPVKPPDSVKIAKAISALEKIKADINKKTDPSQFGLLESEITKMENLLAGIQGKEIVTTPAQKQFRGPKWLGTKIRDLLKRDIPAQSKLQPIGGAPPAPSAPAPSPTPLPGPVPISTPAGVRPGAVIAKRLAEAGGLTATKPSEEGQVKVISPDGRQGSIPRSQLEDALAEGYRLVE